MRLFFFILEFTGSCQRFPPLFAAPKAPGAALSGGGSSSEPFESLFSVASPDGSVHQAAVALGAKRLSRAKRTRMVNLDSVFGLDPEALCTLAALILRRRRRREKKKNAQHFGLGSQSKTVFGREIEAFKLPNGDCGGIGVLSICHNDHSDNR